MKPKQSTYLRLMHDPWPVLALPQPSNAGLPVRIWSTSPMTSFAAYSMTRCLWQDTCTSPT